MLPHSQTLVYFQQLHLKKKFTYSYVMHHTQHLYLIVLSNGYQKLNYKHRPLLGKYTKVSLCRDDIKVS
jgi:hypothetical protein